MNTQIFHFNMYDLKGHWRSILALTQPFPYWMVRWCFTPKLCVFLFLSISILFSIPLSFSYSFSISLFCSMQTFIYILKGHMWPLLCRVIFNDIQIFWSNYNLNLFFLTLTYVLMTTFCPCFNLNLRSYGQLFVLVLIKGYISTVIPSKNANII